MPDYIIKPLILSRAKAEMSFQTYLTYVGEKRIRAYVMWYIQGGGEDGIGSDQGKYL